MDKIKEFFGQLFTQLSNTDSIAILSFLGVSFLLGLLFGAWSRAAKIRRLKKELGEKDAELKNLKVQYDSLVEQYEKKEEALKDSEARFADMTSDVNRLTNERMHYKMELDSARQHLEQLQAENLEYATKVGTGSDDELDDVNTVFEDEEKAADSVYADRLALIEEKLEKLELENANLRDEVATIESRGGVISSGATTTTTTPVIITGGSSVPSSSGSTSSGNSTSKDDSVLDLSNDSKTTTTGAYDGMPSSFEEEIIEEDFGDISPQERSDRAKASIRAAIGTKIPTASLEDKDDLKKLNGVGPFIEKKLNDIGIYTFEQISQLDADLIQHVTDAIQFFPGRIEKDDWMGQARGFMG